MPTEAEWEYVCRADTKSSFSSGDKPPGPEISNAWGLETCWDRAGQKAWEWDHKSDGTDVWTQWWENKICLQPYAALGNYEENSQQKKFK